MSISLASINFIAVTVSAILFFALGATWYSAVLFGPQWIEELKKHNLFIEKPSASHLLINMLLTFGANFIACCGLAVLVHLCGITNIFSGFILGTIAAIGIAAPSIASIFIWENRSLKLFLLDVGYPAAGIIAATMILSMWR